MRRTITALIFAFAAFVALANEQPNYGGFASFGWGSDYNFIKTEQLNEGYEPFVDDGEWLWYRGSMHGCDTEFGYSFEYGVLHDGVMIIENNSQCWSSTLRQFREIYTRDSISSARYEGISFVAPDTKIRMWITDSSETFVVSYYWRPSDE